MSTLDVSIDLEESHYKTATHQERNKYVGYLGELFESLLERQLAAYFQDDKYAGRYVQVACTVISNDGNLMTGIYYSVLLSTLCHDFSFQKDQEVEQEKEYIAVGAEDLFYPATFCRLMDTYSLIDPDLQEESLSQSTVCLFLRKDESTPPPIYPSNHAEGARRPPETVQSGRPHD